jgi:DNA polymerase-4
VPPDGELAFLHPLPVDRLWGVGEVTAAKLNNRGVMTVGDLARLAEKTLIAMLGKATGRHLHALAHNRDPRPVVVGKRRGSIGSQRALGRSRKSAEDIDAVLCTLADRVTRRMRTADRTGRTVVLRLRFDDFSRVTRSHTLPWSTSATETVLTTVRFLTAAAMPLIRERGLTLIGISVGNLDSSGARQLALPFDDHTNPALDGVLDRVHDRFGSAAITRAVLLGRDPGMQVPMLPD